jgi:poly(A) polymerase
MESDDAELAPPAEGDAPRKRRRRRRKPAGAGGEGAPAALDDTPSNPSHDI